MDYQWRPLLPLPPGLYDIFGTPITDAEITNRADFSQWFLIKPRKGAVAFQLQEPVGDERVAAIYDTLGSA